MNYQAVLFDFDGVLCRDRFYEKSLVFEYPEVYDWIQDKVFSNHEMVHDWMRNKITSNHVNKFISENTGISLGLLEELFQKSVYAMELNEEVVDLAKSIKILGKKIGIVTDNMDIFSKIVVPKYNMNILFNVVINSADYGILKKDENGRLFNIALGELGEKIENSLLIDDSESKAELFKRKGGNAFVYKDLKDLKLFLNL